MSGISKVEKAEREINILFKSLSRVFLLGKPRRRPLFSRGILGSFAAEKKTSMRQVMLSMGRFAVCSLPCGAAAITPVKV